MLFLKLFIVAFFYTLRNFILIIVHFFILWNVWFLLVSIYPFNKYLSNAYSLHGSALISEDALTDKTDTCPCVPVEWILYC